MFNTYTYTHKSIFFINLNKFNLEITKKKTGIFSGRMEFVFLIYSKCHLRKLHSLSCWKTLLNSELDLKTQRNECTFIPSAAIDIRSIKKRPTLVNRQNMVIDCDNEKSYVIRITREKQLKLGWSLLRHTPYLPDLLLNVIFSLLSKRKW